MSGERYLQIKGLAETKIIVLLSAQRLQLFPHENRQSLLSAKPPVSPA